MKRPLRRSHIISPFGVGAIVDFPRDESLIVAGLDAWPAALEECPPDWLVREERLEKKLRRTHFRLPPDYRISNEGQAPARAMVPFLRFPRWHYCDRCGSMEKLPLGAGTTPRYCRKPACEGRRRRLIPLRFVAACEKGHVEDVPWRAWVHNGEVKEGDHTGHELSYRAGRSAGLSGISIHCSCGRSRTLSGIFAYEQGKGSALSGVGYTCTGFRPWLDDHEACGEPLRVLQKGATNLYFPQIVSSLYLPVLTGDEADERVERLLDDPAIWGHLTRSLDNGRISTAIAEAIAAARRVSGAKLLAAAQKKLDNAPGDDDVSDTGFRRAEYDAITSGRGGPRAELFVERLDIDRFEDWMPRFFSCVYKLHKLRETRVLCGFSRILPPADETDGLQTLARQKEVSWLPSLVVRGEGLFIDFRREAIEEWQALPGVRARASRLARQANTARLRRKLPEIEITAAHVLVHTFAHLLMRQLCFDCGYGNSALRERLYTSGEGQPFMCGVLVYTAAGDSEGTLGGLVRQGDPGRLEGVIRRAMREATWCSSDPVCIESTGQGTESANLAACHSCSLAPETSCETGNRYLDRGLVVGPLQEPQISYFADVP